MRVTLLVYYGAPFQLNPTGIDNQQHTKQAIRRCNNTTQHTFTGYVSHVYAIINEVRDVTPPDCGGFS